MSSITNRTLTLVLSESLKFAVQFLSPIFLVRILDVNTYGQYREFIVYSTLVIAFISFGVKSNLLYFVSKDIRNKKYYVTNTIYLLLLFSVVGLLIIFLFQSYISKLSSFNFVPLLIIYVFCFQNIDLLDNYWLSIKRSDYVLYWATSNALIRTLALLIVAYITKDIISIIYLMIVLEILKTAFTILYISKAKLFTWKIDFHLIKEQLYYLIPNGFAGVIVTLNNNISKVVIASSLGPAALAVYSVGSQNLPFLNIVRSSIYNVLFPEIAKKTDKDPEGALSLWHTSNILYIFLITPLFILFFFYADKVIILLFTRQYAEAIQLFRIYLILLILRCFDMNVPIRAMNKNKFFVIGSTLFTISNILLIYILYRTVGFVGPAIAAILSELIHSIYLGSKIISIYDISLNTLLSWNKILKMLLISLVGVPILLVGSLINQSSILIALIMSSLYMLLYLTIFKKIKIKEVDLFMSKMLRKVKITW